MGPEDWALLAVLEFTPAQRQSLLKTPVATDPAFPASFVQPWFPPALQAQWQTQADGTLQLKAGTYDASALHSPPLQHGWLLPFGEGGVLLYLYTQ